MHVLDLSTFVWRLVELSGKKEKKSGKSKSSEKSIDEEMDDASSAAQSQGRHIKRYKTGITIFKFYFIICQYQLMESLR